MCASLASASPVALDKVLIHTGIVCSPRRDENVCFDFGRRPFVVIGRQSKCDSALIIRDRAKENRQLFIEFCAAEFARDGARPCDWLEAGVNASTEFGDPASLQSGRLLKIVRLCPGVGTLEEIATHLFNLNLPEDDNASVLVLHNNPEYCTDGHYYFMHEYGRAFSFPNFASLPFINGGNHTALPDCAASHL